jgi:anti-sigma factor RsiW
MTCEETVALLSDYLETALGPDALADLERHLGECAPCVAYLNTFRAARRLVAEMAHVEMPEETKERLRSFLLARLR